jgi:protein involved in polysaccharide export with SLBB domain
VIVGGQVHLPGPVHLGAGTTLTSVIDRAGGATPFGSIKRVRLQRGAETRVLDLSLQEHQDELLLPHDVVVVPEKMVYGN